MKVPLIDLVAQYHDIQGEIDEAIHDVLEAGQFILGKNVRQFEQEVADYLGAEYAIGVGSGTDALVLGLRALGVGPGDEVIAPAYTFYATVEAIMALGAKPVIVDVYPDTFCINIEQVDERIGPRTKAVIPVHLYGHAADMAGVMDLANNSGIHVVEDNAQAFGAEYKGRKTGGLGHVGCQSFFPTKNLGGYGDGGMVVTNDAEVAQQVQVLRTHGWKNKYFSEEVAYNSRLDELQAAILRVKLRHLDQWNDRRRELAEMYTSRLAGTDIGLPRVAPNIEHVYHMYMVRLQNRQAVQQKLTEKGIAYGLYYPQPVHLTKPCRDYGYAEGDFPESERACEEMLALPFFPEMTTEQVDRVVEVLREAVAG